MKTIDRFRGKYAFLSNFYPCVVLIGQHRFESSEHAYQAYKASSLQSFRYVASSSNAKEAKKRGSEILCVSNWEYIKLPIMQMVVSCKFFNNEELKEKLLDTDDARLVEGNWWGDTFWGVCDGKGYNYLGEILMEVRSDLVGYKNKLVRERQKALWP